MRGDLDQAVEAMAESDHSHTSGMAVLYPWLEQARATVLAAAGDLPAAVDLLCELVTRLQGHGFAGDEVLALHDLVRLGRAEVEVGRSSGTGRRQTVVQRLAVLSETVDGPLSSLLARHGRAEANRSGDELLAVADSFAEFDLNVFAAEATSRAVTRLREARSPRAHEANVRLTELLQRCDVLRTPALSARRPALTDRERQIARLAAGGIASRDIADQLYISTRTVENHLQRVYNKLGVTGRSELWPALRAMPNQEGEPDT